MAQTEAEFQDLDHLQLDVKSWCARSGCLVTTHNCHSQNINSCLKFTTAFAAAAVPNQLCLWLPRCGAGRAGGPVPEFPEQALMAC